MELIGLHAQRIALTSKRNSSNSAKKTSPRLRFITGDDLIALGIQPGPQYRKILDAIYMTQPARSKNLARRDQAIQLARQLKLTWKCNPARTNHPHANARPSASSFVLAVAAFFAICVYFHLLSVNSDYYYTWNWQMVLHSKFVYPIFIPLARPSCSSSARSFTSAARRSSGSPSQPSPSPPSRS